MAESPFSRTDITTAMFTTVGQLSVNWSLMEFTINALVAIIFKSFDGQKILETLPWEFTKKTRFLREWLKTKPDVVKDIQANLLAELDRVGSIVQYRDDVIHGHLSAYDDETKTITFIVIDRDNEKTTHLTRERKVTAMKLLEVGVEAGEIGHNLVNVVVGLIGIAYGPDEANNLLSKLTRK